MILVWIHWVKYITKMNFLCFLFLFFFFFNVGTRTFKITEAALLKFPRLTIWGDSGRCFSFMVHRPCGQPCSFSRLAPPGTWCSQPWWASQERVRAWLVQSSLSPGLFSLEFSPRCLTFLPSGAHPLLSSLCYSDSTVLLAPFSPNTNARVCGLLCLKCKMRGLP